MTQAQTVKMTRRGFAALAQDAVRAVDPAQAQCSRNPSVWAQAEVELAPSHERRTIRAARAAIAARPGCLPADRGSCATHTAISGCHGCPLSGSTGPCAQWAQLDAYTGVAGGVAFVDGQPVADAPCESVA